MNFSQFLQMFYIVFGASYRKHSDVLLCTYVVPVPLFICVICSQAISAKTWTYTAYFVFSCTSDRCESLRTLCGREWRQLVVIAVNYNHSLHGIPTYQWHANCGTAQTVYNDNSAAQYFVIGVIIAAAVQLTKNSIKPL